MLTTSASVGEQAGAAVWIGPALPRCCAHLLSVFKVVVATWFRSKIMQSRMSTPRMYFKVRDCVIGANLIAVMTNISRSHVVTGVVQGEPMLGDVATLIGERMCWYPKRDVAVPIDLTATAPPMVVRTDLITGSRVVAGLKAKRIACEYASLTTGTRRNRRWFAATALTDTGRIRQFVRLRKDRTRPTSSHGSYFTAIGAVEA